MRIEKIEKGKKRFLPLLLLADPCEEMIDKYIEDGSMYVLYEEDRVVSECVLWERPDGDIELKNLATDPAMQHKGYAKALLQAVFSMAKADGYHTMYVGTCGAEGFYESLQFTYAYTEKDFFLRNYPEPVIDNGVQCIDMVYLRKDLLTL